MDSRTLDRRPKTSRSISRHEFKSDVGGIVKYSEVEMIWQFAASLINTGAYMSCGITRYAPPSRSDIPAFTQFGDPGGMQG